MASHGAPINMHYGSVYKLPSVDIIMKPTIQCISWAAINIYLLNDPKMGEVSCDNNLLEQVIVVINPSKGGLLWDMDINL